MSSSSLPVELAELVAAAVLSTYSSLPLNGKPKPRSNGAHEWTVLAGFCTFAESVGSGGGWQVECVALGTGLKVLPHAKLPPHGDVLHDSHAEIVARRGLLLWLYTELERAAAGEHSALRRSERGWRLRDGLGLGMYVSTLPCGDASTYSLALLAPPSPTLETHSKPTAGSTDQLVSSLLATSLGLHVSRSPLAPSDPDSVAPPLVHRGRVSYSSISSLRTKPGRLDSPPTTSHSCSDKLAMWTAVGVQGALLSALGLERIELELLVVGGVPVEERERVGEEVARAVGGRLGEWEFDGERAKTPRVAFTELGFEAARSVVAVKGGVAEEDVLSCPDSLSYIASQGVEVLVNGVKQGAKTKRKLGEALGVKSRSRLCKLSLFSRYRALSFTLHPSNRGHSSTYALAKCTAQEYQERKRAVRATGAPLHGWLVSGARWEGFGVDGKLREGIEEEVEVEG